MQPKTSKEIIRNRETGALVEEVIVAENVLRYMYQHKLGYPLLNAVLNNKFFCELYGIYQSLPISRSKIAPFARQHEIAIDEIELPLQQYPNFNAFFSRKLKSTARPFDPDPSVVCSPADGKVLVYPALQEDARLPVKGQSASVSALLDNDALTGSFSKGAALVLRLAPYDYHRFHFPDTGDAGPARSVDGKYHSVNPIALSKLPQLYQLNKRAITRIDTQNLGTIVYIEVGALTVGSIVQTYIPGNVQRGQEKGYFQYGGSTLILLFEANRIRFDDDLIRDTEKDIETIVKTGTQIGRSID